MLKIENGKPVVYKDSKNMGTLIFKEVSKEVAKDLCIKYHYAHKWNAKFGRISIGVFRQDDLYNCLGVASFGNLMNEGSHVNISDDISYEEIVELNRLWVDDCLGKNTETMLLSASWTIIKYYKKIKVVQSFADGRLGCGTIYKAASFKYYGYSDSLFLKNIDTDEIYFHSLLNNTHRPKKMLELITLLCDNKLEAYEPRSYRYIYCLDKKVHIKLKELPYPEYHKGFNNIAIEDVIKQSISAIFRGYIISKLENVNMNSSQIIAKFILNNFDEDEINNNLNTQKQNEFIKNIYGINKNYNNLLLINNWIEILKNDSLNKQKIIEVESLW